MKIYNTLTRQKEEFIPIKEGEAKIYACGPTVYNFIHIGNARPICVFDVLRRYMEYRGLKVTYVQNFTDIDDKIIRKANEEETDYLTVSRKYIEEYKTDAKGLNVRPATVHPLATESMEDILQIIQTLVEKGYAYAAPNGDVYFRTKKFDEYGKLSHQPLDDLQAGARISVDEVKEDAMDFAVWKSAKPGEPSWDSPWGKGRPGWHIECSAMARHFLGDTIDIHCGGQDLIFPHHENEIAQSECCNGVPFAHYWMHNGYINVDNHKMSKSANNFFTVRELSEVYGYEPIRYFLLTGQYRGPLNYTAELIGACKASLERLYTCRNNLDFAIENAHGDDETLVEKAAAAREKFCAAMDDDLNTPDALAALFDFVREINTLAPQSSRAALEAAAGAFDALTGVLGILYNRKKDEIPADILALVDERAAAKKAKDWARADAIRAELTEKGYVVEDTPKGPKVSRAK
ncbi:MAG: cysteine--tRNA ligase [Faecalispora jeddahensis]